MPLRTSIRRTASSSPFGSCGAARNCLVPREVCHHTKAVRPGSGGGIRPREQEPFGKAVDGVGLARAGRTVEEQIARPEGQLKQWRGLCGRSIRLFAIGAVPARLKLVPIGVFRIRDLSAEFL